MVIQAGREFIVEQAAHHISRNPRELIIAKKVATSIAVVFYEPELAIGAVAHIPLPDSKMASATDPHGKFVDKTLPAVIDELLMKGVDKDALVVNIVGGAQLFNFGGGSGNILNIGTRNAITARTILSRAGIQIEKTETGGNKPRTVILEMETGYVQVGFPGEEMRYL